MAGVERSAQAVWNGDLMQGNGALTLQSSGILQQSPVTWAARTETPGGKTSPEELLAGAHAACFAMAFAATLARRGTPPSRLDVTATASLERMDQGYHVASMRLAVRGAVPGIDQSGFAEAAKTAEQGCPISNALRNNVRISVDATLQQ